MVMGDDSWMKGRGFESRRCMDIFHIDLVYCLFEKTENKLKRCRGRPIFKKTVLLSSVFHLLYLYVLLLCFFATSFPILGTEFI